MSNVYPCPSWCRDVETRPAHRGDVDWSDLDGEASRPHTTAAIHRSEGARPGYPASTQGVGLDIGAEEVAPLLADGTQGPNVLEEALIRIALWVEMPHAIDEAAYDMTADEARALASSLERAAHQLDAINSMTRGRRRRR